MKFKKMRKILPWRRMRFCLSMPFIYLMIVPFLFLDLCLEVYHHVCFPLFGMSLVKRSQYFIFDRHKLPYLKPLERLNCLYCDYANGLSYYFFAIIAETEGFWCGIRHRKKTGYSTPGHHEDYLPYGDKKAFQKFVQ